MYKDLPLVRVVSVTCGTILIPHVMFSLSFVVVTLALAADRLRPLDRGGGTGSCANGFQTFFRVTLPLIAPAVLAAALLTFALSLDDFVITNFNAGSSTIAYPLYIIHPGMLLLTVWQQQRAERVALVRPEEG